MNDLISRSALIEEFRKSYCGHLGMENSDSMMSFKSICRKINNAPTVEPVRGEWETVPNKVVEHGEVEVIGTAERCSNCFHASPDFKKYMRYCPNCGADMRGEKNG